MSQNIGASKDKTAINNSTEQALEETILSPRFYTTDFDEMDKINIDSLRPEWNKLMEEYEADSNMDHFQRPEEMSKDYSKMPKELYNEFCDFLISSITSCGVLCADITFLVYLTPKDSRIEKLASTTGKSLSEPMIMATCKLEFDIFLFS